MNITLILFLIGILGFVLNRKNIILMLICIEIMLLSITFLILVSSLNIDDETCVFVMLVKIQLCNNKINRRLSIFFFIKKKLGFNNSVAFVAMSHSYWTLSQSFKFTGPAKMIPITSH